MALGGVITKKTKSLSILPLSIMSLKCSVAGTILEDSNPTFVLIRIVYIPNEFLSLVKVGFVLVVGKRLPALGSNSK
jgi:hypothetical protein